MTQARFFEDIVDLSVPLKSMDTPVYPGYPQPLRTTFTTIEENGYYSNIWCFAEHTATHVDAPVHFLKTGKPVNELPPSKFAFHGVVLDFSRAPKKYLIGGHDIKQKLSKRRSKVSPGPGWIFLFYTGYSKRSRSPDWLENPGLSKEGCEFLVRMKIDAVGFDAAGPDQAPFPAHKTLLPKGILIYENLANLDRLLNKNFLFLGAPLNLVGGSASPCRPFALML